MRKRKRKGKRRGRGRGRGRGRRRGEAEEEGQQPEKIQASMGIQHSRLEYTGLTPPLSEIKRCRAYPLAALVNFYKKKTEFKATEVT